MNIFNWLWSGVQWVKALGDSDGHLQVDVMSYEAIDHGALLGLADDDHTQYLLRTEVVTNGWQSASETWTYGSADSPTFTFTISGDKTTKYSPGMRIKLTQTTVKYFIITVVAYVAPTTTITIYGGTDYTLVNAAISSNYYSMCKAPLEFPLNPTKWTVQTKDTTQRSQASPVNGTWYNMGSVSISIPMGIWRVNYEIDVQLNEATAGTYDLRVTLSTANNSESDANFTWMTQVNIAAGGAGGTGLFREKILNLTVKTSYYINTQVNNPDIDTIYNQNSICPLTINAICAYL